jgi:hypothetical protein
MSGINLNQLVRDQILAEMPQMEDSWIRERAITREINSMTPEQLLERISAALDSLVPELSVRLGL